MSKYELTGQIVGAEGHRPLLFGGFSTIAGLVAWRFFHVIGIYCGSAGKSIDPPWRI